MQTAHVHWEPVGAPKPICGKKSVFRTSERALVTCPDCESRLREREAGQGAAVRRQEKGDPVADGNSPELCPCGQPGRKRNGGLCDACLQEALRREAAKLAQREGRPRG